MKRLISLVSAFCFLILFVSAQTYAASSPPSGSPLPPVEQPLVREGAFAVKLAQALKLINASNEVKAESTLASAGVAPRNGWIADYPVTPSVLADIRESTEKAAEAGKLAMNSEEADNAVGSVSSDMGLLIVPASANERIPPKSNYYGSEKIPPQNYYDSETASDYYNYDYLEDYYYDTGPPIVTYYPPPWGYDFLYSYVPFPFWWGGIGFGGFFVLNDFDRVRFGRHHRFAGRVTNQVTTPSGTVQTVSPLASTPVQGAVLTQSQQNVLATQSSAAVGTSGQAAAGVAAAASTGAATGWRTATERAQAQSILNQSVQHGSQVAAAGPGAGWGASVSNAAQARSGAAESHLIPHTDNGKSVGGLAGRGQVANLARDRDIGATSASVPRTSTPFASGAAPSFHPSAPSISHGPGVSSFGAASPRPSTPSLRSPGLAGGGFRSPSFGGSRAAAPGFGGFHASAPSFGGSHASAPSFGGSHASAPSMGGSHASAPSMGGFHGGGGFGGGGRVHR